MKVPTYVTQAVLAYFTQRARTIARKRIDSLSLGHSRRRSLRSRCSRRRRLCGADLKLLPISQSWNKGPSLSVSFYAVLCVINLAKFFNQLDFRLFINWFNLDFSHEMIFIIQRMSINIIITIFIETSLFLFLFLVIFV